MMQEFYYKIEIASPSSGSPPFTVRQYNSAVKMLTANAPHREYLWQGKRIVDCLGQMIVAGARTKILSHFDDVAKLDEVRPIPSEGATLPEASISFSRNRAARYADLNIQFISSVSDYIKEDLLVGKKNIPLLSQMLKLLDASDYVLAGSEHCANHLATYFDFPAERIIRLPTAPQINPLVLDDGNFEDDLGDVVLIYLNEGPNTDYAPHCASLAKAIRAATGSDTIRVMAAWDIEFGGAKQAPWAKFFDRCRPVTNAQRQWLMRRSSNIIIWGTGVLGERVSAEAQILGRHCVLPMTDTYRPVDNEKVQPRAKCEWIRPNHMDSAIEAAVNGLFASVKDTPIQEDIVSICDDWLKGQEKQMLSDWNKIQF